MSRGSLDVVIDGDGMIDFCLVMTRNMLFYSERDSSNQNHFHSTAAVARMWTVTHIIYAVGQRYSRECTHCNNNHSGRLWHRG